MINPASLLLECSQSLKSQLRRTRIITNYQLSKCMKLKLGNFVAKTNC